MTYMTDYAANGLGGITYTTCNGLGFFTESHTYGNTYYMASMPAHEKQFIFAHEAGHAFGLEHSPSNHNLMYYNNDPYLLYGVYTPQSDDKAGVNAHY